jgi:hypothetical protein
MDQRKGIKTILNVVVVVAVAIWVLQWVSDVQSLSTDFLRRLLALAPFGPFDERLLQLVDLSSFISVAPLERLMGEIIQPEKLRRSTMKWRACRQAAEREEKEGPESHDDSG